MTRRYNERQNVTNNSHTSSSNNKDEVEIEEKSNLISLRLGNSSLQLLSNLIYRCRCSQDMLRDIPNITTTTTDIESSESRPSCGLLQILSMCSTDVSNPLRREWALLCLRNACEGMYVQ